MALIFVKPAVKGNIVRHPEKLVHVIAQEGEYVEDSIEWRRYLQHGDIVICEPPVPNKSGNQAAKQPSTASVEKGE